MSSSRHGRSDQAGSSRSGANDDAWYPSTSRNNSNLAHDSRTSYVERRAPLPPPAPPLSSDRDASHSYPSQRRPSPTRPPHSHDTARSERWAPTGLDPPRQDALAMHNAHTRERSSDRHLSSRQQREASPPRRSDSHRSKREGSDDRDRRRSHEHGGSSSHHRRSAEKKAEGSSHKSESSGSRRRDAEGETRGHRDNGEGSSTSGSRAPSTAIKHKQPEPPQNLARATYVRAPALAPEKLQEVVKGSYTRKPLPENPYPFALASANRGQQMTRSPSPPPQRSFLPRSSSPPTTPPRAPRSISVSRSPPSPVSDTSSTKSLARRSAAIASTSSKFTPRVVVPSPVALSFPLPSKSTRSEHHSGDEKRKRSRGAEGISPRSKKSKGEEDISDVRNKSSRDPDETESTTPPPPPVVSVPYPVSNQPSNHNTTEMDESAQQYQRSSEGQQQPLSRQNSFTNSPSQSVASSNLSALPTGPRSQRNHVSIAPKLSTNMIPLGPKSNVIVGRLMPSVAMKVGGVPTGPRSTLGGASEGVRKFFPGTEDDEERNRSRSHGQQSIRDTPPLRVQQITARPVDPPAAAVDIEEQSRQAAWARYDAEIQQREEQQRMYEQHQSQQQSHSYPPNPRDPNEHRPQLNQSQPDQQSALTTNFYAPPPPPLSQAQWANDSRNTQAQARTELADPPSRTSRMEAQSKGSTSAPLVADDDMQMVTSDEQGHAARIDALRRDSLEASESIVHPSNGNAMVVDAPAGLPPPTEIYERIVQVGEGTYGKVYKAKNVETGALVALKRIRMEAEKDGFPVTAVREIKLLQNLRHPNVVNLIEMMVSRNHVYMVFEYVDHDLTGVLHHPSIHFTPAHLKSLMKQFLEGLGFIHHRGILHRDLKGSNILLSKKGELKIADFGLARFYKPRRGIDYTNRVITQWYKPPELLFGATVYGSEVDMWSAGCIFLELFARRPVFQGQDEIHQLDVIFKTMGTPSVATWPTLRDLPWYELVKPKIVMESRLREIYSKWISPKGLDLAEHLLCHDPIGRPDCEAALRMEYFTTEEPTPEMPDILVKGEWHEYESKRARKRQKEEAAAQ